MVRRQVLAPATAAAAVYLLLLGSTVDGSIFGYRESAAAIFGRGPRNQQNKNNKNEDTKQAAVASIQQQQQQQQHPPPPPPPPSESRNTLSKIQQQNPSPPVMMTPQGLMPEDTANTNREEVDSPDSNNPNSVDIQQQNTILYPTNEENTPGGPPESLLAYPQYLQPNVWQNQPPNYEYDSTPPWIFNGGGQQQQPQYGHNVAFDPHRQKFAAVEQQHHHFHMMQQDFEAAMQREQNLAAQLVNATNTLLGMEQREELHIRQLDVLTERVMEVEARAAQEHNQLLEYQANCSAFDLERARLRGEVKEWKARCLDADNRQKTQQAEQTKLAQKLEKAIRHAEDLAARVERHRLDQVRESYQQKQQSQSSSAKRLGWLGWLFGGWNEAGNADDEDEQDLTALREEAKATLLNALKTERNNVEELETIVSALEQNNSAIALQVRSRDEIIDELNERVAVFEEDKVVLKAALRQLQKEMSEEAPKLQKLTDQIEEAHQQVEELKTELESLREAQALEIEALQDEIAQKQESLNQVQSNFTMIGEYVDKLEERLSDFALSRRDMDRREKACAAMEAQAQKVEEECESLQKTLLEKTSAVAEIQALYQELIEDRDSLKEKLAQLLLEKDRAAEEVERLRVLVETLEKENVERQQQQLPAPPPPPPPAVGLGWNPRNRELQARMAALSEENSQLMKRNEESDMAVANLRRELYEMIQSRQQLEVLLRETKSAKTSSEEQELLPEAKTTQEEAEVRLEQEEAMLPQEVVITEGEARFEGVLEQQSSLNAEQRENFEDQERQFMKERIQEEELAKEQECSGLNVMEEEGQQQQSWVLDDGKEGSEKSEMETHHQIQENVLPGRRP